MFDQSLNERELSVFEAIVRNYILNGTPTGSRFLSKQKNINVSPATVRNVMGDLEEMGLITHPHTSAGRIPTDKGYRIYVDRLMKLIELPREIKKQIKNFIVQSNPSDMHMLLEATSKALSKATRQLGVVLAPKLHEGVFRHVHIHKIGERRYLMNLAIDSGFIKTMVLEFEADISSEKLELACTIMNNRFNGMELREMCSNNRELYSELQTTDPDVIRLFVPSLRKMIKQRRNEEIFAEGETNILLQPEFFDRKQMSTIIEILEEKKLLVHLFGAMNKEPSDSKKRVAISIGGENEDGKLLSFSVVKTSYHIGNMEGTLGIIGPKRMPYGYLVSAVDYTANVLENLYK
ncbi:MAG: heat-inducible transcription repressor HrcA [Chitinivibrionales bacterium]|nr:heat-inducible transcription repressor HrcA [Chitinivibrionales bacterium]